MDDVKGESKLKIFIIGVLVWLAICFAIYYFGPEPGSIDEAKMIEQLQRR